MKTLGLVLFLLALISTAGAMGLSHPSRTTLWQPFHFDGTALRPGAGVGTGTATILVRDGYLPFVQLDGSNLKEKRLPDGTGALVGFCYLQSVGGKLQDKSGIVPVKGVAVALSGRNRQIVVETDSGGYFVAPLPPGEYTVRVSGLTRNFRVEKGQTSLASIRIGKRLGD